MAAFRIQLFAALALALLSLAGASPALAVTAEDEADVAAAELLAHRTWYEGIPQEQARALGDGGIAYLIDLLDDPTEASHHAQVIEILGLSGHVDAYAAISAEAARVPDGELDRAAFRKRVAILVALGHLARDDDRALDSLEAAAARDPEAGLGFRRGRSSERETSRLMRRSAVSALALSGHPEARRTLRRLEAEATADPDFATHVRGALREHDRQRRVGPRESSNRSQGAQ